MILFRLVYVPILNKLLYYIPKTIIIVIKHIIYIMRVPVLPRRMVNQLYGCIIIIYYHESSKSYRYLKVDVNSYNNTNI